MRRFAAAAAAAALVDRGVLFQQIVQLRYLLDRRLIHVPGKEQAVGPNVL